MTTQFVVTKIAEITLFTASKHGRTDLIQFTASQKKSLEIRQRSTWYKNYSWSKRPKVSITDVPNFSKITERQNVDSIITESKR
jgi:hypothetical protein